ncbi:T6SS phospholipase effector Tle1-like catalytic domain-containing protein [Sorangium sp. So ce426]|uniref:T6SS phospholipase effector Tle1-like catalytic domain-containing protein n=1 Tax=Sorangium sp. So ce426 TaxID=3133312 RepID=UPI003F5B4A23
MRDRTDAGLPDDPSAGSGNWLSQSPFEPPEPVDGGVPLPAGVPMSDEVNGPVQICHDDQPPRPSPLPPIRIRVSFFFDGTGNNRTNVSLGPEHNSDDSYAAGLTNVAKLESAGLDRPGPCVDRHLTIYIEGIGTVDGGDDSGWGSATGQGDTGVQAKVDRGLRAAIAAIVSIVDSGFGEVTDLHIDTFGFSRGAAAARYCVWKCMTESNRTLKERLESRGVSVGTVMVKFVGLYDTVASFGLNHSDDTAELHLDSISVASSVIQLAAAEEHRANFPLTNINSSGSRGRQLFLPGVHSDIGGGYADHAAEVDYQLFDLDTLRLNADERAAIARERRWLVDTGWYRSSELQGTTFWNEVRATRRGIRNTYARIPLWIMAAFARTNGVPIAAALESRHPIPADLRDAYSEIQAYIRSTTRSSVGDWFKTHPALDPSWHIDLRHGHLHFSARYGTRGGAHSPQWSSNDPVRGHRMRNIYDG